MRKYIKKLGYTKRNGRVFPGLAGGMEYRIAALFEVRSGKGYSM